ncbi:MAG: DUF2165 domain-containing protein [Alphaproteobacteria bacterium]|nr:MAG: DUF2165 domain-containing protein [Alphaproteobacteria bacterium]
MTVRYSKIALLAAVALYVTLVVFNNVTDYGSNFAFVSHVLMMDTTFPGNAAMGRALADPIMHHAAYVLIIACETLIAVLAWAGCLGLWRGRREAAAFARAKVLGVWALTLGILLWFAGFVAIGGEWFLMWQSEIWNGVATSFRIATLLFLLLLYLTQPEKAFNNEPEKGP